MEKQLALLLLRVLKVRGDKVHRKKIENRRATGEDVLFRTGDGQPESEDDQNPPVADSRPSEESDMEKQLALLLLRVLKVRGDKVHRKKIENRRATGEDVLFRTGDGQPESDDDQNPPVADFRPVNESDMEKRLALLLRRVMEVRGDKVHREKIENRRATGEDVLFRTGDGQPESDDDQNPPVADFRPVNESDMEKRLALLLRRVMEFRTKLPIGLWIEADECLRDRQKNFQNGLVH